MRGAMPGPRPEPLYRSNSSLDLELPQGMELRGREYGSHGSIDVMNTPAPAESFFAMLQDYQGATDQRSPGPAEYLRGKVAPPPSSENASNALVEDGVATTSPKLRLKLHRFWGGPGNGSGTNKPPRHQTMDDSVVNNNCTSLPNTDVLDDRQRRRAFAHYDVQSLSANLGYAARLRGLLLARRRNTATGASAASMMRSATPEAGDTDEDTGDGRRNHLLESCPFFRNEVGGEAERVVSLTRAVEPPKRQLHRPPLSYGVSVLEFPPGETHWRHGTCPYQRHPARAIETVDKGATYYRNHFYQQEHQNWFGLDESLGPVAISLRRERLSDGNANAGQAFHYRILIRTSELSTLRGSILEDGIPNLKVSNSSKGLNTKEVLEFVAPEIQLSCLRLGLSSPQTEQQLLKLDEQGLTSSYKVGVLYCRAGQGSEEDMYNNEESGPALVEFLDTIGQRVRLKGFDKYRAGLDNKTDSTGLYSVYSQFQECEIMFHVSTLLPFTPNNRQQLLRKRHIGNDIVTIVFQEPGALPFTPKNIRSQFQHVFIIVRAVDPCTDNTRYSVAVSRSKEVPVFGPPIHDGALFPKSKAFAEFLLAKVINAENAAHRSEKFATMATRTRQEYLKDLANNYTTTTVVDTGQKFSMLSFSSKKKERGRPRVVATPTPLQRGALSWQVTLDDSGQGGLVDCILGLSTDSLVLVEDSSREMVFVTPTKSVLGWATQGATLRLYHHQGECVTLHMRDACELPEVCTRLRAVSAGASARDLALHRSPHGQLGFHVQPDGVVTQVETSGPARQAGLVQGDRLVEICKVAVCTLSHDQMVDLLKTSATVTAVVLPPSSEGVPKRGCAVSCWRGGEGDYENVTDRQTQAVQQQVAGSARRSPSGSSGYSSGGRPSDPWYEVVEAGEVSPPPPPLPARRPHDFKLGDKVTCLLPLQARIASTHQHLAASLPIPSDGHSTDTSSASERLFGVPSEDELSTGSTNVSPRVRRAKLTPASGQSPRDKGEARLRPGVTPRSSNRGSAHLSNSTLQEDLMRLINPDYNPDTAPTPEPGETTPTSQVIVTTARPATVISNASTASSPAPSGKESPRVNAREMDWPSLVDTATRAMLHDAARQADWAEDIAQRLSIDTVEPSARLARETRRRLSLEEEVRRLRDENRRLQEESQAAAQQLRMFTEWFFQTIDRQT